MADTQKGRFQALALTGGGYRGLFTAKVLETIEASAGKPIGQCFDLVTGTSIGGIIALAVAFEIPMRRVVEVFESRGDVIFPPQPSTSGTAGMIKDLFRHARRPRYKAADLRETIEMLIPKGTKLGDALHPVAIPAVNLTEGRPQVFKTRHVREWNRDWKLPAVDIALATAAAPTFFEIADVDGSLYADGGLFANAPDLIALHEAEHFLGVNASEFWLLSIGTTTKSYSVSMDAGRTFGIYDWMRDERLFSVIISAQQQFVDQIISHRLGDRYVRVDKEPSQEQAADLGLDRADQIARKTLKALAGKAATDVLGSRLPPFLSHIPTLKLFKEE